MPFDDIGATPTMPANQAINPVPRKRAASHRSKPEMPLHEIIQNLMEKQRLRVSAYRMVVKLDNMCTSHIARVGFGYSSQDMNEAAGTKDEGKAIWDKAKAFKAAVESELKGKPSRPSATSGISDEAHLKAVVAGFVQAKHPHETRRNELEKGMEELAKLLPVWEWVSQVSGFGAKGLGIIVGEAGDLTRHPEPGCPGYRSPEHVWSRLGLAVFDGRRQGNPGSNATKDDWIRHHYNKGRRAEIWTLADSMFRHQWAAESAYSVSDEAPWQVRSIKSGKPSKDAVETFPSREEALSWVAQNSSPARPKGPYGSVYKREKDKALRRIEDTKDLMDGADDDGKPVRHPDKWNGARVEHHARRLMSKALIEDLWRVWNGLPPKYVAVS